MDIAKVLLELVDDDDDDADGEKNDENQPIMGECTSWRTAMATELLEKSGGRRGRC